MNRLANVYRICAYFSRQCNRTDHVARMGADPAATEDIATTVRLLLASNKS